MNEYKNEKLKLWNKVKETDPKYTKKANVKGNNLTSIAPQYQIKMATEHFGPYGTDWGFKTINLDYTLLSYHLVVVKALFYYPGGEFEIINSVQLHLDNAREKIDDNFAKKVETDLLTKALSKLGFNADIFMGMFDDPKYLDDLKKKYGDQITLQNLKDMFEEKKVLVPEADMHYYEGTIDNAIENNYSKLYHLLSKMKP